MSNCLEAYKIISPLKGFSLAYFKEIHRCTCEGGPEHPCLYPKECYEFVNEIQGADAESGDK